MRIQSLEIANFRSFERARLTFDDRVFIIGDNNTGKSTTVDAILWDLAGIARGVDRNQKGIADLVRDGTEKTGLGVRLDLENFGLVQRQTNGREVFLKVKEWVGSNADQQRELYEKIGASEPVLRACMNSAAFLDLHHAEAKDLIFGILNVQIPADKLAPHGIPGPLSLEQLDAQYRKYFDERKLAKRQRDEFHVPDPPALPEFCQGEPPPPLEELERDLEELRTEERSLIAETATQRGARASVEKRLEDLRADKRRIETKLAELGDPDAEIDRIENALEAYAAPTAEQLREAAAEDAEVDQLKTKLADERGRLRMITDSLEGIEQHRPDKGCVLDSAIPCKTEAKAFAGRLKQARADLKALEKSIEESSGRLDLLGAAAVTRKETAVQEAKDKAGLERRRAIYTGKKSETQTADDRLTEILAEIATAQTELAMIDPVEDHPELAPMRARIERGQGIVDAVRQYYADKRAHDAAAARKHELETKAARLEGIVDALGPKGLIVEVLERARETFETAVNERLERWGYRLQFQIDPWMVLVDTRRAKGRPSVQLSESERLRVGIALQLAIAELTGLWFVAIDRVDMMTAQKREILLDVLDGWRGQAVICMTKEPDYDLPTSGDGMVFYRLELDDHEITRVTASAAAAAA